MIKTVRDAAAAAGRDPDVDRVLRGRADVHRRRLGAHARPVPLVRRDGRQPRRRHRREVRRRDGAVPEGAHRLHRRAARATTTTRTARPTTTTSTSCPTRSSTGSASSAPPTSTSRSSSSCARSASTQFAGYLQHDNKEETLRVYGETVIPALSDARDGEGMTTTARPRTERPRRARARSRRARPGRGARGVALGGASASSRARVVWELYKFLGPADGVVVGASRASRLGSCSCRAPPTSRCRTSGTWSARLFAADAAAATPRRCGSSVALGGAHDARHRGRRLARSASSSASLLGAASCSAGASPSGACCPGSSSARPCRSSPSRRS